MEQARQLLQGNYKSVAGEIKQQMLDASEDMNFELAASLRDRLQAVESLQKKQLVTAGTLADTDVIGYAQTETKACFAVLHFSGGNLLDKDYEILPVVEDVPAAVSSLIKQYYLSKGYAPRFVLLPCEIEDGDVFSQLLEQEYGRRPHLKIPQRGDNVRLVELANKNAKVCACIGAGPVSKACFEAIVLEAKELKEVIVCDLFIEKAQAFADEMAAKYNLKATATTCLEDAVRASDIISVAASSVKPINIDNSWLKPGSLIMFTGRCNIDEEYYLSSKIVWDHAPMHEVYFDEHLQLPENERFVNGIGVQIYRLMHEGKLPPITEATSLGDVINGTRAGRESEDERICFITGGIPVWDVGWSYEILQNAKKLGLGQKLKLWDTPALG